MRIRAYKYEMKRLVDDVRRYEISPRFNCATSGVSSP